MNLFLDMITTTNKGSFLYNGDSWMILAGVGLVAVIVYAIVKAIKNIGKPRDW